MSTTRSASPSVYGGLFLVTLATIMYEIVLTRIFSVTMRYHFAFVAISVAMFGMTVGALARLPAARLVPRGTAGDTAWAPARSLFGVAIVFSFLTQLSVPFRVGYRSLGLYAWSSPTSSIAVPFVFSGIVRHAWR